MNAVVTGLLAILELIAPAADSVVVEKIVNALVALVPFVIQEAEDLYPIVKNIITGLRGNSAVTTGQLDQLDTMEATLDAKFDAADAKAQSEDNGE